jgi:hypothetical protein
MHLSSRAAASALLPLLSSSSSSLASSSSASALSFAAALSSRAAPRLRAAQALQLRRSSSSSSRYGGGARDSRLPLNLGFVIVPQQRAYVVERLGRFSQTLPAGLAFLIPFVDRVAYVHSLKEEAIAIQSQTAITRDNVTITMFYPSNMDTPAFAVENLTKPAETVQIEGSASTITPQAAADHLLAGAAQT